MPDFPTTNSKTVPWINRRTRGECFSNSHQCPEILLYNRWWSISSSCFLLFQVNRDSQAAKTSGQTTGKKEERFNIIYYQSGNTSETPIILFTLHPCFGASQVKWCLYSHLLIQQPSSAIINWPPPSTSTTAPQQQQQWNLPSVLLSDWTPSALFCSCLLSYTHSPNNDCLVTHISRELCSVKYGPHVPQIILASPEIGLLKMV